MSNEAATSMLEVVIPVADYQDIESVASAQPSRTGIKGKRVVLLPSEKSSSPPFIRILAQRMIAHTDAASVFMRHADWPFFHPQRNATVAPEIDQVAHECDLMISGVAY